MRAAAAWVPARTPDAPAHNAPRAVGHADSEKPAGGRRVRSELACRASGQKWGGAGAGFELRRGWAWGYFQAPAGKKKLETWKYGVSGLTLGCYCEHLLQSSLAPK